jgi:hypothetical protein
MHTQSNNNDWTVKSVTSIEGGLFYNQHHFTT